MNEARTITATLPASLGTVRTARKPWRCVCSDPEIRPGRRNPNYREVCEGDISPGTRYYEYMGEAAAYQSGLRYCMTCAITVWAGWS